MDTQSYTVSEDDYKSPTKEERDFIHFHCLPKENMEQIIYHLKALIKGF